jgi:hypothetical protein
MPSNALAKFENKMLVDVTRIIDSHATLNHSGGGRRGLGHITRSGILMLCASWELYVEELAVEIADCLANRANAPTQLPLPVQKELSRLVRDHKHDLKPLELAGSGWEQVYTAHVREVMGGLNTPKSNPIDESYKRLLGWENPSQHWTLGKDFINDFVKVRGDIAHRGSDADYVRVGDLKDKFVAGVSATVIEHDNAACDFLNGSSVGGRPWRRRA